MERQRLQDSYFNKQILYLNNPFVKLCIAIDNGKNALRIWKRPVTIVEGIPEDIPSLFPPNCHPGILLLLDLMPNCSDKERILDRFTTVSQHCDVTCIYLTQNLFPPGKVSRSIPLNAHYVITFNNPHNTLGFRTLAQQVFAGRVPYI